MPDNLIFTMVKIADSVCMKRAVVKHPLFRFGPAFFLLLICLPGCFGARQIPRTYIKMAGAQIPLELVESWLQDAKGYDFNIERVYPSYLSQNGFEHLAKGACDLACTDRQITERELRELFPNNKPEGCRIAFYGYALYVNPKNPVDNIYAGHLRQVFKKKITDWKELGGPEGPIQLYGPRKSTRGGNVLMVQAQIWFADPTWQALDSDNAIIDKVATDPQALGFASIGYDQGVRYLGLRMDRHGVAALPSLEEIESERYGLAKVIYVYFLPPPSGPVAQAKEYLLSEGGRRAIQKTDAWPVPPERAILPPTP